MGKVDRLPDRLNLLLPCFGLSALYLPTPDPGRAGPASLHCRTQSMSLYGHSWFNSQHGRVAPPPFHIWVYYLSMGGTIYMIFPEYVLSPVPRVTKYI